MEGIVVWGVFVAVTIIFGLVLRRHQKARLWKRDWRNNQPVIVRQMCHKCGEEFEGVTCPMCGEVSYGGTGD